MEDVEEYIAGNRDLRQALGLAADAALEVVPLGKGEHNENFMLTSENGARSVLRVNRLPQPFHDNQVAYEFAALKALEPSCCVPRALYLDDSARAPGKGVLVESFCPGEELNFDRLKEGDLAQVARIMANVHSVPVADNCPLFRPCDSLQQLFQECVDRFKAYQGTALEDPRFTAWIRRFFAATQRALDEAPAYEGAGHIINTETLPSHFLLSAEPGQLGAFVDWERPIVGEVAQDLAFFVAPSTTFWDSDYLFPRENIQAFVEDYWRAVDGRFGRGNFDARFNAWLAVSVLRSQTWFCKNAARYANGGVGHTVQRTFEKWDIYTSDEFNEMLLRECF